MTEKKADETFDTFLIETLFPDAFASISTSVPSVDISVEKCDVVLDTNVLLLPYTTGSASLKDIEKIYCKLQLKGRLFVPTQVAREFVRNRTKKIADILGSISAKRSSAQGPSQISYPLITDLAEYGDVLAKATAYRDSIRAYQDALGSLADVVKSWGWDDPVSKIYRKTFSKKTLEDHGLGKEAVLAELKYRTLHDRPPGYKDSKKDDGGVGDIAIWLTILAIAKRRKKPLIFVTGEEKSDWHYRADNQAFLPRFELVDEYRQASAGEAFHIVSLSRFLELFDASDVVISEVRDQEQNEIVSESTPCLICNGDVSCQLGVVTGSSAISRCDVCDAKWHVHRVSDGSVMLRKPFSRTARLEEEIDCPVCGRRQFVWVAETIGASAKPRCEECKESFHAHRAKDNSVVVNRRGEI